jgi:hypothetical protein
LLNRFFSILFSKTYSTLSDVGKTARYFYQRTPSAPPSIPVIPIATIRLDESLLRNAFQRVTCHPTFPAFILFLQNKAILKKEPTDRDEEITFNYFKSCLTEELSLGKTLELLKGLSIHPQITVDQRNVVYFQMLHEMESAFNHLRSGHIVSQRIGKSMLLEDETKEIIKGRKAVLAQLKSETEVLTEACRVLKAELYSPLQSEIFDADRPPADYLIVLEKILFSPLSSTQTEILGRLIITLPIISFRGKHFPIQAIFIQCSAGKFRLYDSDFKEFSDAKTFIEALRKEIPETIRKSAKVFFSIQVA